MTCTTFRVAGREYALDSRFVQGAISSPDLHPVPLAPDAVLGVTEVDGRLVPCLDGALLLSGSPGQGGPVNLLLFGPEPAPRFGLVVEAVTGVRPDPSLGPTLPGPSDGPVQAIHEEGGRRLHYLDPARLAPAAAPRPLTLPSLLEPPGPRRGSPLEPLLLSLPLGDEPVLVDPAGSGPFLPPDAFERHKFAVKRLIGTCRLGRRRLPVLVPRARAALGVDPTGLVVVVGTGFLAALLVDGEPTFEPAGGRAPLDPSTLVSRKDLTRMQRLRKLKNWRVDRPATTAPTAAGVLHVLSRAGGIEVALPAADVVAVLGPGPIVPVPNRAPGATGLLERDGRTYPAVDLEVLFRRPTGDPEAPRVRPALLVRGADAIWAIRVDDVGRLLDLRPTDILDGGRRGSIPLPGTTGYARHGDPPTLTPILDAAVALGRLVDEATDVESGPDRSRKK